MPSYMQQVILLAAVAGSVYGQSIVSNSLPLPSGAAPVNAPANSIPVGGACGADAQCEKGAQCFAQTSMTIPSCGGFNAQCTTDDQCNGVTCQGGLCAGGPKSSSTDSSKKTPLGGTCTADAQCENGAQCFAQTSETIRSCGGFNAKCTTDDQCNGVACQDGLCSGAPKSSSMSSKKTPLGGTCNADTQCENGAQCFAQTSDTIASCGGFNAKCTNDNQCNGVACQDGLCSGAPKSSSTSSKKTPLGGTCNADSQCENGAQCFAQTSDTIASCGGFNAKCTNDNQCNGVACQDGLCSGAPKSSSTSSKKTPLGGTCKADTECENGAQCFAQTSETIPSCGGFNAKCTNDNQCNGVTCQNGLCSGAPKPSSVSSYSAASKTMASAPAGIHTPAMYGSHANTTSGGASPSMSAPAVYTGAAVFGSAVGGVAAVVAGAAAWML